jgi:hypothetical protein
MTKIRVKKDFWVLIGVDCYILSIFNPCRWAEGLLLLVIFPTLVEPFFVPLPEVVVYLIIKVCCEECKGVGRICQIKPANVVLLVAVLVSLQGSDAEGVVDFSK